MSHSFLATIAFAILVIVGSFLANLVVLVFTSSQWHVSGVVLAIAAAAASYWAQNSFTVAGYSREAIHQLPTMTAGAIQAANEAAVRSESFGNLFQLVAIAFLVASVACFWLGMR